MPNSHSIMKLGSQNTIRVNIRLLLSPAYSATLLKTLGSLLLTGGDSLQLEGEQLARPSLNRSKSVGTTLGKVGNYLATNSSFFSDFVIDGCI